MPITVRDLVGTCHWPGCSSLGLRDLVNTTGQVIGQYCMAHTSDALKAAAAAEDEEGAQP